jgi:chromosome segregation ATPase
MSQSEPVLATLSVENVGGIESTEVSFEPGITVLAGRNATNRTSLLRSVIGVLGSDDVSLKADAEEGRIELEMGGETYTRRLSRRNGTVVTDGDPYLDDPADVEVADLFAFLLESNEARRAVAREDDLHDVLMRPIDTTAIEREINELVARRDRIDGELEELDELAERLPGLEERRRELGDELESLETDLEAKRAELEDADESLQARREEQSELDDRMSELEAVRSEFTGTRQRLRTERNSIESLEDELAALEDELEELPAPPEADADVEAELSQLRERRDRLNTELRELQSVVQFNEKMLDGTSNGVVEALRNDDSAPTEELLPADERSVVCWTCGSEVEEAQLEETVADLRTVRREKLDERSELDDRIDELQSRKREQERHTKERRRLEGRIESTESEIAEREERAEDLEGERDELEERIDDLEAAVREAENEEQSELLDLNREVNELEFERDQVRSDIEAVEDDIDRIETRLDEREDLEAERAEVSDRLADRRTRIDRTETRAVEQFNEHMEEVLSILDYGNLDRVWIERKQQRDDTVFDLHVVRATEDGAAYEDHIDHLSESEREVVGLVFALAGYLVHDVHETVPFLLLDSLEALDSERIAALVEYFGEYPDALVVALLPEDAAAVDDEHPRVRDI